MKLDTSRDRYAEMEKLFRKAIKLDNAFRREAEKMTLGDIIGLLSIMQNLTAMDELIRTEMILEDALNEMLAIEGDTKETREKFISVFGDKAHLFLRNILLQRINVSIGMAEHALSTDRRLTKFRREVFEIMTAMRDRYKEIYKI